MINILTGLGYGIVGLAIIIGLGIVITGTLASNVASCPTGFSYQTNGTAVYTTELCCNETSYDCAVGAAGANWSYPSTATRTVNTMTGYLGTGSGGLASWIPLVIIFLVGMVFLGAFMARKGKQS